MSDHMEAALAHVETVTAHMKASLAHIKTVVACMDPTIFHMKAKTDHTVPAHPTHRLQCSTKRLKNAT